MRLEPEVACTTTSHSVVLLTGLCASLSGRIKDMRIDLHDALTKADAPGEWTHVLKQIGMFSYTGLTPKQVSSCQLMLIHSIHSTCAHSRKICWPSLYDGRLS